MRSEPVDPGARGRSKAWVVPLVLATLGGVGWACQDMGEEPLDGPDPLQNGEVTRADVLRSVAFGVVVPATADFSEAAQGLRAATEQLQAEGTDEARLGAQQAWRDAMDRWQAIEMMQVGPTASSLLAIGGEDRRDAIYSWPTVDSCSIDRVLVDGSYEQADFFTTQLVWAYGLDAMEYLLFSRSPSHTCPSQVQLDAPWAALDPAELERRRDRYAAVLAADVAQRAAALASRWSPQGDDFATALAVTAQGDSPYESDVEALDEVFHAMFYLDQQTKDAKLGVPMGYVEGCPAVPCVDAMEQPHGGGSLAAIATNLRALRRLVQGGDDPAQAVGFDDLLAEIGEESIAQTLLADIDEAIARAEAIEGSLQEAATTDPAAVQALFDEIKEISDVLKGPFVMALMLTIPAEGAGDAD